MRRSRQTRRSTAAAWTTTAVVVALALTGCGGSQSVAFSPAGSSTSGSATEGNPSSGGGSSADVSTSTSGAVPADLADKGTPGAGDHGTMGFGRDMPAIPAIIVPDVSQFSKSNAAFAKAFKTLNNPVKGVAVSTARCDGSGRIVNTASLTAVNNGDGSGTVTDGAKRVVNGGDGSGTLEEGATRIVVGGDGSGTYDSGATHIVISKDGSGTYEDGATRVVIAGDGSGTYEDGATRIVVTGDGSGTYEDGALSVVNAGDGSGSYEDGALTVVNNGEGTAHITVAADTYDVPADPLPPVAKVDKFPPVKSIKPVGKACGTLIRLSDQVLFDFDKDSLRPSAKPVLDSLALALKSVDGTLQVNGHTDSVGSDSYNDDLSQRRAQAVSDALEQRGVTGTIVAKGFGESRPIAANTVAGKDNPSGRQLNRRVEIVVPVAG